MFKAILRLYSFAIAHTLVVALRARQSSLLAYLSWFWRSKTFRSSGSLQKTDRLLVVLLFAIMLLQIVAGVSLLIDWALYGSVGYWAFGLALLVSYPLLAAMALALSVALYRLAYYVIRPKKLGKIVIARLLERQVKRLRKKHKFTVVAIAGSIGKTSTKLAVAQLLSQRLRVRYEAGNYNDRITVPLIFFDQRQPALFNLFAWAKLLGENAAALEHTYPYDVVVVEIGTDGPGQMKHFAYLKPDITILTAITPEHMEFFGTLDAVAAEELTIFQYSKRVLVNGDDIPGKYLAGYDFEEYSMLTNVAQNYHAHATAHSLDGQTLQIDIPSGKLTANVAFVGKPGAKYAVVATAVADMLGMSREDIKAGLSRLEQFPGRMQLLEGIKNSRLIDDSYNASPEPVKSALDVLYEAKAPQRIAILGNMNELGEFSREAHEDVGRYCSPKKLDLVVTIGPEAKRWLAPAAKAQGCQVRSFMNPYDAGDYVRRHLKEKAVVLAEGSQNGVFCEEALKPLLAHPADTAKLVRQSRYWLRQKAKQFKDVTL